MTPAYMIFHLNMAFSSIPEEKRGEVIEKCYHPLLDLAGATGIPIGIELTGWTLAQIGRRDEGWVARFRDMLDEGRLQLIGSGWSQLIGPLVPAEVNRRNQQLGLEAYRRVLGRRPKLALVNEMAFSTGLVERYAEAGYEGIIMDRDNVRLALALDHTPLSTTPTHALGTDGTELPVLWSDSILFQRFQRVVHGDIPAEEYLSYVAGRAASDGTALPIYCNDAETFDYRPGRFQAEPELHGGGEWERMERICRRLSEEHDLEWVRPGEALTRHLSSVEKSARRLTSVTQPVPVKKKSKYNISRWAVTGRDDLKINTLCHRVCRSLEEASEDDPEAWRALCELWASDYRTHITEGRWREGLQRMDRLLERRGIPPAYGPASPPRDLAPFPEGQRECRLAGEVTARFDEERFYLEVSTAELRLTLNLRRGLTLYALAFRSHGFEPLLGTLPQGYFDTIELGADFYSGVTVIELPAERNRQTDLEWVTPSWKAEGGEVTISAEVPLSRGALRKWITLEPGTERLRMGYSFPGWECPLAVVRTGTLTLIPDFFAAPLQLRCVNGGGSGETFPVDRACDHSRPGSTLVSCSSGFGATTGEISLGSEARGLTARWDPARCAAMPMLQHTPGDAPAESAGGKGRRSLTRIYFSLGELDESSRAGGTLPDFELELRPYGREGEGA